MVTGTSSQGRAGQGSHDGEGNADKGTEEHDDIDGKILASLDKSENEVDHFLISITSALRQLPLKKRISPMVGVLKLAQEAQFSSTSHGQILKYPLSYQSSPCVLADVRE